MRQVLLVSPSSKPGGSERALAGLARHPPTHGWSPTAVLLEPGPLGDWLEAVGCTVTTLLPHRTRQIHRTVGTILRRAHLARSSNAEVVVSNMDKGHV